MKARLYNKYVTDVVPALLEGEDTSTPTSTRFPAS